jgi:mRNA-degrading endonuclease toxin of MazEF toxin-antitoxin module
MMVPMQRGDIYWFDFKGTVGAEPDGGGDNDRDTLDDGGRRPGVVVQAEWLDSLDTAVVVPLTGRLRRRGQPTCVFLPRTTTGLPHDSVAVCHLIFALDQSRADEGPPVGSVSERYLLEIEAVLVEVLGIGFESIWNEDSSIP